jgi:hypothetical protein
MSAAIIDTTIVLFARVLNNGWFVLFLVYPSVPKLSYRQFHCLGRPGAVKYAVSVSR